MKSYRLFENLPVGTEFSIWMEGNKFYFDKIGPNTAYCAETDAVEKFMPDTMVRIIPVKNEKPSKSTVLVILDQCNALTPEQLVLIRGKWEVVLYQHIVEGTSDAARITNEISFLGDKITSGTDILIISPILPLLRGLTAMAMAEGSKGWVYLFNKDVEGNYHIV